MTSIVTALKTDHDIRALGQPVDDLALAFVAPLRSDDDHVSHCPVALKSIESTLPRAGQKAT
jgi:hypothetical protein